MDEQDLELLRHEIRTAATKLLWNKRTMMPEHTDEIVDDVLDVAFPIIVRGDVKARI